MLGTGTAAANTGHEKASKRIKVGWKNKKARNGKYERHRAIYKIYKVYPKCIQAGYIESIRSRFAAAGER